MYLFDTDVITNILKKAPSKNLVRKLGTLTKAEQFISTITIFEIVYGACKSSKPEYHLNNLKEILLPAVNILTFDTKAAYVCGHLRADLEKNGKSLTLTDIEIASIAIANDLTLITGNIKHFERIPLLTVENWI